MTKFKEYLRSKEIAPECDVTAPYNLSDFEINTCAGIETTVETRIMDGCIVAVVYSNIADPEYAVYDRSGACSYFDGDGYKAYIRDSHCDPEYIDFLYDTGCNKSFGVLEDMEWLYLNDAKVRIAFKHMSAGIMDWEVFYRWISDHYNKYIGSV